MLGGVASHAALAQGTQRAPAAADASQASSIAASLGVRRIEFERLPKDLPPSSTRRVLMHKIYSTDDSEALDLITSRLRSIGYFELSSNAVEAACAHVGNAVSRWAIRVDSVDAFYADGTGAQRAHEVVVPDGCTPASGALAEQLTGLRNLGRALFENNSAAVKNMSGR